MPVFIQDEYEHWVTSGERACQSCDAYIEMRGQMNCFDLWGSTPLTRYKSPLTLEIEVPIAYERYITVILPFIWAILIYSACYNFLTWLSRLDILIDIYLSNQVIIK